MPLIHRPGEAQVDLGREHLKVVQVACTDPGHYAVLLEAATGREEVA